MFKFESLTLDEKAQQVWDKGRFLASRQFGQYLINLYTIHNFFVEVWFRSSLDTVYAITAFTNSDHLESYVENVSLKEIFE